MFKAIVNSKQGKVWANHPLDQRMIEVADVEENADQYLMWAETLGQIRNAPPERVAKFANLLNKHITFLSKKKIENNVDENVNLGNNINSDRGNPEGL